MNLPFQLVFILVLSALLIHPVPSLTPDPPNTPSPLWTDSFGSGDVSCSDDGAYIVAGSGGIIRMYTSTGKILWTFKRDEKKVKSVAISGNGEYVSAVFLDTDVPDYFSDAQILFFNRSGGLLWEYDRDYTIHHVAISDDGNTLYASGSPRQYSFDQNGTLLGITTLEGRIWSLESAADGSYAVAGSALSGNRISVFNRNGIPLWNYSARPGILCLKISHQGKTIVSAGYSHLYLFDRNGTLKWQYNSSSDFRDIAVSPDGEYIAGGAQYYFWLFNQTGSLVWQKQYKDFVHAVGFSHDSKRVIAGTSHGIEVYDLNSNLIWNYPTPKAILHLSTAEDAEYFVAGTSDMVYFFNDRGDPSGTMVPVSTVSDYPVLSNITLDREQTTKYSPIPLWLVIIAVSCVAIITLKKAGTAPPM